MTDQTTGQKTFWLPIKTAPRDGTVIDVWLQESLNDIKFYCQMRPVELADGKYGGRSAGWFWLNGKFRPWLSGLGMPVFVEPTHWMPLPGPPK